MATFVIVHGAWTGSWSWVRVIDRLRARGHKVHAPTLSGLAERSHLNQMPINLTTHIDDIVNEVLWNDLEDIDRTDLLAEPLGHPGRHQHVYLDAFVPEDGQGFTDFAPGWELRGQLTESPPSSPGDYLDEADRAWVDSKATPQPTATLTERLKVTGAYKQVPTKTYIVATGWDGFQGIADGFRGEPGWTVREVKCGHDVPIDKPEELSGLLEEAAR